MQIELFLGRYIGVKFFFKKKLELESTYHTSNKEQASLGLSLLFARWCQCNVLEFVWMILFPPFLFFKKNQSSLLSSPLLSSARKLSSLSLYHLHR